MSKSHDEYYVPAQSYWPIVGSIGLGFMAIGGVGLLPKHDAAHAKYTFMVGSLIIAWMLFGWFRNVVTESLAGLYSRQMDRSFRWGMVWFIFSEVMFFAAFFGALLYVRTLSVPWLAGEGAKLSTHVELWEHFKAAWPLINNPDPNKFHGPIAAMGWGLPAINTMILLTSGITVTWAHHALKAGNRKALNLGLLFTVLLGILFLGLQVHEYQIAMDELGLSMGSGIYGSTFFMLTGFHGAHVCIGTIMLIIMLGRSLKGHFTLDNHFAFEATAWYWHFVDVVWLVLFIFVYWL